MTKFVLAVSLALGTFALGCTPSPDKVCNHMFSLAKAEMKGEKEMSEEKQKKGMEACLKEANAQKEKDAEVWKCMGKCAMDADSFKVARKCDDTCGAKKKSGDDEEPKAKKKSDDDEEPKAKKTDDDAPKKKKKPADDE